MLQKIRIPITKAKITFKHDAEERNSHQGPHHRSKAQIFETEQDLLPMGTRMDGVLGEVTFAFVKT